VLGGVGWAMTEKLYIIGENNFMKNYTANGFALSGVCQIEEDGKTVTVDLEDIEPTEVLFIEGVSVTELYIGGEVDSWGDQIEKKDYAGGAVFHKRMVTIPEKHKFSLQVEMEDETIRCKFEPLNHLSEF